MTKKWPKMTKKNFGQKNSVFFYRDLALAVSVVLPPWDPFFYFSFPSYSRFRKKKPGRRTKKSFPTPLWAVGAPSASISPSALNAQAG